MNTVFQKLVRTATFNITFPLWLAFAVWLAATDRVAWWVVILVLLSHVKIDLKVGRSLDDRLADFIRPQDLRKEGKS